MKAQVDLSFIIPLFNERESIEQLHERIVAAAEEVGRSFEVLFVNDGSTDGSDAVIDDLCGRDTRVGGIHFRRNFGKAAALDAGFRNARGRIIFTMDGDLQDDPKEIGRFLDKLDEGYDLVSGWKKVRHDPLGKRLPSKLFNRVVSMVSGLRLHDFNCGFKAYRREAIQDVELYGELHRFVPVLVYWEGFAVGEIEVEHHARRFGRSKYGLTRLAKGFFDLLTVLLNTRYRTRPLHLFGWGGVAMGSLGGLILLYLAVLWFAGYGPIGTRPLLFLGLLLIMLGGQTISTGLLGEMIARQPGRGARGYNVRSMKLPGEAEAGESDTAADPAGWIRPGTSQQPLTNPHEGAGAAEPPH